MPSNAGADWDALDEGKIAYSDDVDRDANPYPKGSHKAEWWDKGWERAEKEDPLAEMFKTDDSEDEDDD